MNASDDIKNEILFRAEKVLYYNNLLIAQCNSWLPAEEGNKNMMRKIMEKEKAKRKKKIRNIFENNIINKIVEVIKKNKNKKF